MILKQIVMSFSEKSKFKVLVLSFLNENGIKVFTLEYIKAFISEEWPAVFRAIRALKTEGLLLNIQRGLNALLTFADQNILAYQLATKGGLAYWSAHSYHGPNTQFSNTVLVQTPGHISSGTVMYIDFRFIKSKDANASHYDTVGRANEKLKVTNIEKKLSIC
jgi:predicted transcriptional regulator of viral defense system